MLNRNYSSLLEEFLLYFPCVALIGARQCGKTTLMKNVRPNWTHFDLESNSDLDQISSDPDFFLRQYPRSITIDEAQLLPQLFSSLRVAIDSNRSEKGRFIITGSSSPELLSSISETLAGRVAIIEMSPLSINEAFQFDWQFLPKILNRSNIDEYLKLEAKTELKDIEKYWLKGGYPEPWLSNNDRFQNLWMDQYISTYLQRDLAKLFPGLNRNKFNLFLPTLASLNGDVINYSKVARAIGVSQPTAREYFQIAHGTFLWRTIPSYEKNTLKRIVKHPKGYYRDSGLLNHLLRINELRDLQSHPDRCNMWEAVVIEQIIRFFSEKGIPFDYYYYRTSAGAEVDLIIESEFGTIPFEIKLGQTVTSKSLSSIKNFMKEVDCSIGFVINNDEKVRLYAENLVGVPFSMF